MNGGKISIATAMFGVFVILIGLLIDLPRGHVASANTATTSVTVLNTPPQWTMDAQESPSSATTTAPTNIGSAVTWTGSAFDTSGDDYFLLICKTSGAPTPHASGRPDCNGGIANQWTVSATTTNGAPATAATTTVYESQFSPEFLDWFGWVCDGASGGASCNPAFRNGSTTGTDAAARSPFVVNHPPSFTAFYSNSSSSATGLFPGDAGFWYATATDPDTYGGMATDTVILSVCRTQSFNGFDCTSSQQWTATSGNPQSNPTTTFAIPIPYPDAAYPSYGYIRDLHGNLQATTSYQGSNYQFYVNNVAPTVAVASVAILNATKTADTLVLTGMATKTTGFRVEYTVTDNNSCQNASGTPEIVFGRTDMYRSGITQAGCSQSSQANENFCYPFGAATTTFNWNITCTASSTAPAACTGTSDPTVIWQCDFPLWYVADPTDVGSQFSAQDWRASVQAADNNFATSALSEGTTGRELYSFLAYDVQGTTTQPQLLYGSLQPGQNNPFLGATTDTQTRILSTGNVGLDITLYGNDMCTTYNPTGPSFGCFNGSATSTIAPANQRYASSSGVAWADATSTLQITPGVEDEINVQKSVSSTTQLFRTEYWAIAVPGTITQSGDYRGQNTLIGIVGESGFW